MSAGCRRSTSRASTYGTLRAAALADHLQNRHGMLAEAEEAAAGEYPWALRYESDLAYELLTGRVQPWSYREFEGRAVSVVAKPSAAMRANPHLRVHIACGYHDGATPYFAAEQMIAHLPIPAELHDRIEVKYYEAGHMM